jgi:hypothetical protein
MFTGIFMSGVISSCTQNDPAPAPTKDIAYIADGRSVKLGDPLPIAIDMHDDGAVDYTVFVELTANAAGDHLYAGINPIGPNLIKSGPADENRFLSMGFLIAEMPAARIHLTVGANERWTGDHSALAIRHTGSNGAEWLEGPWGDDVPNIVGIQHVHEGKNYFGWLRLRFDAETDAVTLIDYAYEKTEGVDITAGDF